MGIIGRFVANKIGEKVVLPAAAKLAEKPVERYEKKQKKKHEQFYAAKEDKKVLVVMQKVYEFKDKLNVYDSHKTLRYRVTGEFFSLKRHLHIFNSEDVEIGEVKQKLIALRNPLSVESKPVDFDFIVNGQRVARLKSKTVFNDKLVLSNGWVVKGNFLKCKYKILDKRGKELANISNTAFFLDEGITLMLGEKASKTEYDAYRIEFDEGVNELLVLMIVLAVDIYNAPSKLSSFMSAATHKEF